jgi:hypothetical protein
MEEVLGKSSLEERGVLFLTLVSNGHTVLRDKKERIKVVGEAIDLPETEVATFHIGRLINSLKLYSCWSPIVSIVQGKTGYGHSECEIWEKFEAPMKEMALKRIEKLMARERAERPQTVQISVVGQLL